MKKITYCILTLLIICGISMYSSDDKVQEPSENDLRIWFPSGYEIMKRVDMNDIEVVQELEERLGFSLHYKAVSGDIDSSFQAQMSDLSDVDLLYYTFSTPQITSALKNGLFLDYSEYLDRMPHLKKEFEEHPELYQQACPKDTCVVFPATKENAFSDLVIAYRSDWARSAGYDAIHSLTELQEMLEKEKALYAQEKLPQQGTYFIGLSSYNSYIDSFMRLFQTGDALYEKENTLSYGVASEEYRTYLSYLKQLYQKKLLDPRIYETSPTDMEKFFLNSQSAAILTTYDHARQLQEFSVRNGDDIPLTYVTLEQLYGDTAIYRTGDRRYQVLDFGYVIKAGLPEEKLDKALAYLDYLYSDEGTELANYGIQGRHYEETKQGKRYVKEITEENTFYPISISPYVKQDLLRIDAASDFMMLDEEIRGQIHMEKKTADYSIRKPKGYYTEKEYDFIHDVQVSMDTFVKETSMKFIFRDLDPMNEEDWQSYQKALEHMGYSDYMRIQKTALRRSRNGVNKNG